MLILDKQRYWSFLKAYVICYVSLISLYIVIDAFSNLDEFTKRADGFIEVAQIMGRYYLVHQSLFFDQLCGVIGMMAAIFTVTWMQRNNGQLAILAAGWSTHRAIRPVLVSSIIVSFIAVLNQEIIMPRYAEELAKSHDDDGQRTVHVSGRYDSRGVMIHGMDADRASKTLMPFYATIPVGIFGEIKDVKGQQATYIPPDHPTAPLKGGWLVRNATIIPAARWRSAQDEPRAHHAGRRPGWVPATLRRLLQDGGRARRARGATCHACSGRIAPSSTRKPAPTPLRNPISFFAAPFSLVPQSRGFQSILAARPQNRPESWQLLLEIEFDVSSDDAKTELVSVRDHLGLDRGPD